MSGESPVPDRPSHKPENRKWKNLGRAAALLLAVGITVAIILGRDQIEGLAVYGLDKPWMRLSIWEKYNL